MWMRRYHERQTKPFPSPLQLPEVMSYGPCLGQVYQAPGFPRERFYNDLILSE